MARGQGKLASRAPPSAALSPSRQAENSGCTSVRSGDAEQPSRTRLRLPAFRGASRTSQRGLRLRGERFEAASPTATPAPAAFHGRPRRRHRPAASQTSASHGTGHGGSAAAGGAERGAGWVRGSRRERAYHRLGPSAAPNCSLLAGLFASAGKMKIVEEPNTFGYVAACSPCHPGIHPHAAGSGLSAVVPAPARLFLGGRGAGPGRCRRPRCWPAGSGRRCWATQVGKHVCTARYVTQP